MQPLSGDNYALYIEGQRCNFISVTWRYGVGMIPEITVKLPATDQVEDLPDRTAVTLIYRDDHWARVDSMPRYCVMFEGELRSPGYAVSASGQRAMIYQGKHISECLTIPIKITSPDDYIINRMEGRDQTTALKAGGISGSIFEAFNPNTIISDLNNNPEMKKKLTKLLGDLAQVSNEFNIYHYPILALESFKNILDNSMTASQYKSQAVSKYELSDRVYIPRKKDLSEDFKWEELFNQILYQYFTGNMEKVGDNITYFELMQSMLQLFLFEMNINPSPVSKHDMLQIKPSNHFIPVPTCNVILPSMQPQYSFNENWENKITRLIQINLPPSGFTIPVGFTKYYRNIAPQELLEKFDKFEKDKNTANSAEQNKTNFIASNTEYEVKDLVTEEEALRGIIPAENVLPSYLANVMNLILQNYNETSTGNDSKGSYSFDPNRLNSISASGESQSITTESSVDPNIVMVNKFNDQLVLFENSTYKDDFLGSSKSFIPNKIILIANDNKKFKAQSTYSIDSNGKVKLNVNRTYMIFDEVNRKNQEYIFDSLIDSKDIEKNNYNASLFKHNLYAKPKNNKSIIFNSVQNYSAVPLPKPINFNLNVADLTWKSIIIQFDPNSFKSIEAVSHLIGLLKGVVVTPQYNRLDLNQDIYLYSDFVFYYDEKTNSSSDFKITNLIKQIKIAASLVFDKIKQEKIVENKIFKIDLSKIITSNLTTSFKTAYNPIISEGVLKDSTVTTNVFEASFSASVKEDNVEIVNLSQDIGSALIYGNNSIVNSFSKNMGLKTNEDKMSISQQLTKTGLDLSDSFKKAGTDISPKLMTANLIALGTQNSKKNQSTITNPLGTVASEIGSIKKQLNIKAITYKELSKKSDEVVKIVVEGQKKLEDIKNAYNLKQNAEKKAAEALAAMNSLLVLGKDLPGKLATNAANLAIGLSNQIGKALMEKLDEAKDKLNNIEAEAVTVAVNIQNVAVNGLGMILSDTEKQIASLQDQIVNSSGSSHEVNIAVGVGVEDNTASLSQGFGGEIKKDQFSIINTTIKYPITDIYNNYTNPLCQYFFYYNRYKSSGFGSTMMHNPYITPGYPSIIVDNRDSNKNILTFPTIVTHSIEKGKSSTFVSHSLARRANDLVARKFSDRSKKDTSEIVSDIITTKEKDKYGRLYEQLEEFPFFGKSEYSTKETSDKTLVINNTFKRILGNNVRAVIESDLLPEEIGKYDETAEASKLVNREFQMLVITDLPDTYKEKHTKAISGTNYGHRMSKYATSYKNMRDIFTFPDTIEIIKSHPDETRYKVVIPTGANDYNSAKSENDSIMTRNKVFRFSSDIRSLIQTHTELTDSSQAIYVSIKEKEFN